MRENKSKDVVYRFRRYLQTGVLVASQMTLLQTDVGLQRGQTGQVDAVRKLTVSHRLAVAALVVQFT